MVTVSRFSSPGRMYNLRGKETHTTNERTIWPVTTVGMYFWRQVVLLFAVFQTFSVCWEHFVLVISHHFILLSDVQLTVSENNYSSFCVKCACMKAAKPSWKILQKKTLPFWALISLWPVLSCAKGFWQNWRFILRRKQFVTGLQQIRHGDDPQLFWGVNTFYQICRKKKFRKTFTLLQFVWPVWFVCPVFPDKNVVLWVLNV